MTDPQVWPQDRAGAEYEAGPHAKIGTNDVGTFGVLWSRFPMMEERGGYSGPFATREEAEERAQSMARHYTGLSAEVEHIPALAAVPS